MSLRSFIAAIIAGVGTFLVVTVAVTELVAGAVEVPLLVGLPVGLFGGVVVGGAIHLAGDRIGVHRSLTAAAIVIGFAGAFLLGFFILGRLLTLETGEALAGAAIVGALGGILAAFRSVRPAG